jgi:hypothetical protein
LPGPDDQTDQPFYGVLAIALLGSKSLRLDEEHPFFGHATACEADETHFDLVGQPLRLKHVESQPNSRGNLVHILAAGSRGPVVFKLDLAGSQYLVGRD